MGDARRLPVPLLPLGRDGLHQSGAVAASLALVVLVALVDYVTGAAYRLGLLYFVPIALASWSSGRVAGIAVTIAAMAAGWPRASTSSRPASPRCFLCFLSH